MLCSLPVSQTRIGVESGKDSGCIGNVWPCSDCQIHEIDYPLGSTSKCPSCAVDFSLPPVSSHPLHLPIVTLDLDVTDLSSNCSRKLASSTTQLIELDELCSSSPSWPPLFGTTAVKGGLHLYFPTVNTGKHSRHQLEQLPQPSPKCMPQTANTHYTTLQQIQGSSDSALSKAIRRICCK